MTSPKMTDQLFLIECDLDNSLCIVDENDLMCDSEAVKISDNVQFFYKKKVCLGIVKSISCDEKALKKEIKIMMKKTVVQKEPDKLPAKRISKRKKNFSSSDEEENKEQHLLAKKKPKKSVNNQKNATNDSVGKVLAELKDVSYNLTTDDSEGSDNLVMSSRDYTKAKNDDLKTLQAIKKDEKSGNKCNSVEPQENKNAEKYSPTKEELKAMLEIERAKTEKAKTEKATTPSVTKKLSQLKSSSKSLSNSGEESETDEGGRRTLKVSDIPCRVNDKQLFGKDCEEEMVPLMNGIYCKRRIRDSAIGGSSKLSHLVRRLLDGVFTREAIMQCTCTGKPGAATAKSDKKPEALDDTARNAIIDYAIQIAVSKEWIIPPKKTLTAVISQRVGEIKREQSLKSSTKLDK